MKQIFDFLGSPTPDAWVTVALDNIDILLIDHANCEKKAASTALNLMFRYTDRQDLQLKMSQLAREELLHYEKVLKIIDDKGIEFKPLSASSYAEGMRKHVHNYEPKRLVDLLIIGAFIEARSCERFAKIAPKLEPDICRFYHSLLKSEARHYQDYLKLAQDYSDEPIENRIKFFQNEESKLINRPDPLFRFHSGYPV